MLRTVIVEVIQTQFCHYIKIWKVCAFQATRLTLNKGGEGCSDLTDKPCIKQNS